MNTTPVTKVYTDFDELPDEQIELLVDWIRRGAADPRKTKPTVKSHGDPSDWWSLHPLKRSSVPQPAKQGGEKINAIDAFVWRQLRTKVRLLPLRPKEARGILGAERENLEAAKAARRLRRCLMLMPSWKWELWRMGLRRMLWLLPKEAMEPKEAWINQRQISVLPGRPSRLSLRKTMVGRRERLEGLLREAAVERK